MVEQMPKFNIHYSDTSKEAENVVYLAPTTTIQGVFEEVGRKLDILIEEDERKPNYGTFSMYIKKAFPNVKTKALSTDKCNVCDDVTQSELIACLGYAGTCARATCRADRLLNANKSIYGESRADVPDGH